MLVGCIDVFVLREAYNTKWHNDDEEQREGHDDDDAADLVNATDEWQEINSTK
jgi:hypothetical protein